MRINGAHALIGFHVRQYDVTLLTRGYYGYKDGWDAPIGEVFNRENGNCSQRWRSLCSGSEKCYPRRRLTDIIIFPVEQYRDAGDIFISNKELTKWKNRNIDDSSTSSQFCAVR